MGPPPPYTSPVCPPAPRPSNARSSRSQGQGSASKLDLLEIAATFPHGAFWERKVTKRNVLEAPKDQHKRWVRFKPQAEFGASCHSGAHSI